MGLGRRAFLVSAAAALARTASRLPANRNVKWAVSAGLWSHFRPCPFTDILDVMRDTGFIGIRLTGFPGILDTYGMTASQMEREVARRGLHVATISFSANAHDPAQHSRVIAAAKAAMSFLNGFGARHLVVFSPSRRPAGEDIAAAFRSMCECYNRLGEAAGEMGFKAALHNHLDQMVEGPDEVHAAMKGTDPKLFHFAPDTAHLHLAGCNVLGMFERYIRRIVFLDYKDARWTAPSADVRLDNGKVHPKDSKAARFFSSIYDLGDGEIDFVPLHRLLRQAGYKGWICVDLDTARRGPRASYERCGAYVVSRLEPVYV